MVVFLLSLFFSTVLYSMESEPTSGALVQLPFKAVSIDGKHVIASGEALAMSRIDLSESLIQAQDQLHATNEYYKKTKDETVKLLIINACEEILERWDAKLHPQITKNIINKYLCGVNTLKNEEIILDKPIYHYKVTIKDHQKLNSLACFVHDIAKTIHPPCLTHLYIQNVPITHLLRYTTATIFKTCRRLKLFSFQQTHIRTLDQGVLHNPPEGMVADFSNNPELIYIHEKAISGWKGGELKVENCPQLTWAEIQKALYRRTFLLPCIAQFFTGHKVTHSLKEDDIKKENEKPIAPLTIVPKEQCEVKENQVDEEKAAVTIEEKSNSADKQNLTQDTVTALILKIKTSVQQNQTNEKPQDQ